ncbi:hypothetical protein [Terrarubrum flagellatum]|uniref:hypothetical protein n=1 Tax=Terrirubrum flagellatum TaxID=2895980 RepID=UPI003144ED34
MSVDPNARKALILRDAGFSTGGAYAYSGAILTPANADFSEIPRQIMALAEGDVTFLPIGNDDASPLTMHLYAGWSVPYFCRRVSSATATLCILKDASR